MSQLSTGPDELLPRPVVWTIVVAAGSGSRFGAAKQFVELAGRRLVDHAVAVARLRSAGVVAVTPTGEVVEGADLTVAGGSTRSASVRAGLVVVPPSATIVIVHDAARPLAEVAAFDAVIDAITSGADAAVPAVPVVDTLREREGGVVDRDRLVAVQTPQAFRAAALRAAHRAAPEATDDAGLVESAGGVVVLVPGDRWNLKVTEPSDLIVAEAIAASRVRSVDGGPPVAPAGRR